MVATVQGRDSGGWEYPFPPVAAGWSAGDGLGFNEDAAYGAVDVTPPKVVLDESAETPHAWKTAVNVSDGAVVVTTATFQGLTPTNLTGLTAPASGTRYLVLTVTVSLSAANDYVYGYSFSACSLSLESTAPGASDLLTMSTTFKFKIATIVDRVVTAYAYTSSLTGAVIDDATENSRGQLLISS